MIKIILLGNPQSTNHIYKNAGHRVYMSADGVALKRDYQYQIQQQYKKEIITKEIDIRIELFFGNNRKHDIDNYNKILLDSLTGILYEDDSQIQSLLIIKNKDLKKPRIVINL